MSWWWHPSPLPSFCCRPRRPPLWGLFATAPRNIWAPPCYRIINRINLHPRWKQGCSRYRHAAARKIRMIRAVVNVVRTVVPWRSVQSFSEVNSFWLRCFCNPGAAPICSLVGLVVLRQCWFQILCWVTWKRREAGWVGLAHAKCYFDPLFGWI